MDSVTEAGGEQTPSGLFGVFEPFGYGPKKPTVEMVRDEQDLAHSNARMCAYWVLDRDVTQKMRLEYAEKYADEMHRHDENARAMLSWMQAENDRMIEETRP